MDEISESLKEATVKGRQLEGQLTEAGENERALLRQIEDLEGGGATLDRRLKEVRREDLSVYQSYYTVRLYR